jgi:hypothetical protein
MLIPPKPSKTCPNSICVTMASAFHLKAVSPSIFLFHALTCLHLLLILELLPRVTCPRPWYTVTIRLIKSCPSSRRFHRVFSRIKTRILNGRRPVLTAHHTIIKPDTTASFEHRQANRARLTGISRLLCFAKPRQCKAMLPHPEARSADFSLRTYLPRTILRVNAKLTYMHDVQRWKQVRQSATGFES